MSTGSNLDAACNRMRAADKGLRALQFELDDIQAKGIRPSQWPVGYRSTRRPSGGWHTQRARVGELSYAYLIPTPRIIDASQVLRVVMSALDRDSNPSLVHINGTTSLRITLH